MTRRELINSANSTVDQAVKIAGTNYDRRRKVTNDTIHRMNQMSDAGKKNSVIAEKYNVSKYTVKLHTDEEFHKAENIRKAELAKRAKYKSKADTAERAEYKRSLLATKKKIKINL